MAMGYPITDDEKLRILELIEGGKTQRETAKIMGLSLSTINRVKQEFYGKDRLDMEVAIAGNKKYGLLVANGPDHYVGTCLVKGGKVKRRHFTIKGSKNAIAAWEAWKKTVGAIEDKLPEKAKETVNQPKNDIPEKKEPPVYNPTARENANVTTIKIPEKPNTIYVMAVVGELKILKYFTNKALGLHAVELANETLSFAGAEERYCLVEVEPYEPKKLEV